MIRVSSISCENTANVSFHFFDVGANVGLFSILAAQSGSGRVLAFEPDQMNLALLRRNLSDFDLSSRVDVWPVAATDYDGTLLLGVLDCGVSQKSKVTPKEFPCRALSSVISETGIVPAFLKIDVEGAEFEVLRGLEAATGARDVILELEFSYRDHRSRVGELLKLRPIEQYKWEFLLTEREIEGVDVERVDLSSNARLLGAPRNLDELSVVFTNLERSTEARNSQKWELCISPRSEA